MKTGASWGVTVISRKGDKKLRIKDQLLEGKDNEQWRETAMSEDTHGG